MYGSLQLRKLTGSAAQHLQVNPAIILSKTTIACRRSPNTVTTLLFNSHTARPRIRSPRLASLDYQNAGRPNWSHTKAVCNAYDMPYVSATFVADLPTMSDRRDQLSRKFFNSTLQPISPLHSLLPPPRDQLPITRLRAASKFPRIPTRTKKYQSFLSCALAHYQTIVNLYSTFMWSHPKRAQYEISTEKRDKT